jgi:hypothetical protein
MQDVQAADMHTMSLPSYTCLPTVDTRTAAHGKASQTQRYSSSKPTKAIHTVVTRLCAWYLSQNE